MQNSILQHYLSTGTYTFAGNYNSYYMTLPDNIAELGLLICTQIIHRLTLKQGNTHENKSLIYGDMTKFPWYRLRCEDDVFLTASAMTSELFRLDDRGFTLERKVEDKLVVTCRYVSVLMSAILKAKRIPCRSRAGFAPYFDEEESGDHWINQYWHSNQSRWVTFDACGFFPNEQLGFNQFDIPTNQFDWAANTWLDIRKNKVDGHKFVYGDGMGTNSLKAVIRAIFYDFHALMNNEISYKFQPAYIDNKFNNLSENDLSEIDELAELMTDPDNNLNILLSIWSKNKKFRILNSPLVSDWDNK